MAAGQGKNGDLHAEKHPSVRVVLADSDSVFLHGLRAILEAQAGFRVLAEARTGREVVSELSRHQPDLLLMGFSMECGRDALGLSRDLIRLSDKTAVIVTLPNSSGGLARMLIESGVRGVVSRSSRIEILIAAVESVLSGNVFLDPGLRIRRPRPGSTAGQVDVSLLTPREREVFRLLGMEKNTQDIASLLGLSPKTIERHRENIMAKLGLVGASSLRLVAKAHVLWENCGVDYVI